MAAAANAEWDGLTVARRCEACDGRASRKIFLREMRDTYREGGWLVGPVVCLQARGIHGRPTLRITGLQKGTNTKYEICQYRHMNSFDYSYWLCH
jgi:hypothetical protein